MHKTIISEKYPTFRESIYQIQTVHSYNVRHSNLKIPYCRTDVCKQSLLYQGIKAWNILTVDVKMNTSLKSFKNICKEKIVCIY